MSKRRKFSSEFKQGAVEQTLQPGVSCAQVARELGIGANVLARRKREAEVVSGHAFKGFGVRRNEELGSLSVGVGRQTQTTRAIPGG